LRLFVAVNLPADVRRAAWAGAAPLREARLPFTWVPPENVHLTVKFLGEVDDARAEQVGAALSTAVAGVRAFTLGVGGYGAFPDSRRPRVVWCGVELHPALELLANDVEHALQPLGFSSELKPFRPHLTLGRARKAERGGRSTAPLAPLLRGLAYDGAFTVQGVDLMRSVPGPGASTYSVRHAAPFGGD